MRKVKFYSFLFIFGIIISSCSKDYEAEVPTYISINQITLNTNYATEGTSSASITDAWVYFNDDLIGVYELPATFPVLKEGAGELKVFAGIKDNGIGASRVRYLMYDPHVEQINLVKGETITINATVTYSSGANFPWLEDFENASLNLLYTAGYDTIMNKVSNDVYEGNFSGQVFLDPGMDFFEATCPAFTTIPRTGNPVYLEMDFKTNEALTTGVYLDGNQYAVVILNPTTSWKKVYINLTDVINSAPPFAEMKVFFGIRETIGDPFTATNPEFLVDNLKLVHL